MDFIDLRAQQQRIRPALERRLNAILDHGQYILGPEIRELEQKLAAYVGAKHCITCASGTDALLMPLMALGLKPGDAVIVPSFTFVATAEVVALLGATPVFVDVEPELFNIDPASVKSALTALRRERRDLTVRGIIAVDLFGQCAEYDALEAIAGEAKLFLLEDAAQSFGATYKGRQACSLSPISATSFFPAKPLGCYGDGGAIFVEDDGLAEKLLSIRVHGQGVDKYDNVRVGINGRMDTMQAAVVLEKLTIFEDELKQRQAAAERYSALLGPEFILPQLGPERTSSWAQYTVRSSRREQVLKSLAAAKIPSAVYYPKPLHHQAAFAGDRCCVVPLTVSEQLAREVFSIPMHPYLSAAAQEEVARGLRQGLREV